MCLPKRTLLRVRVARCASSERKLCTGAPSWDFWVCALRGRRGGLGLGDGRGAQSSPAGSGVPQAHIFSLIGALLFLPLGLAYTVFVYWTFRGRVTEGGGYH